jgi:transposase-like protein
LKLTDVTDRIRTATETLYQELIDAEASAFIGAGPYERNSERTALRNGSRPRTLTTTAGDLSLKIPKLRQGSFFPALLERRRRIDQALFAVVMEAYLHGVSTRKVDDLVKALGADTGISKSEVSRICADLDVEVAAFRDRDLNSQEFPYVFLDATYCKARVEHGSCPKPSSPSESPVTAAGKSSGSMSVTARTRPSGQPSFRPSKPAAWLG